MGGDVAQLQPIGEEGALLGQHGIEAAQAGFAQAERQMGAGAGQGLRHLALQRGGGAEVREAKRHWQ